MDYQEKLKLAYRKILLAKRILLIGHLSPDADTLSSISAIIELIKDKGKYFYAFSQGKKDGDFSFMPNEALIKSVEPDSLDFFDLIITLDCGSLSRTGIEVLIKEAIKFRGKEKKPFFIEIDHHEKTESLFDLEIRYSDKASTSLIIYDLLKANNLEITKNISNCILSGLISDTGCFMYSNSSPKAISVASEMLSRGASFNKILKATTKNSNLLSLKLWGKAIENLHFNPQTGLASSGLKEEEILELKNKFKENSENLVISDLFGLIVSFICSLKGVKIALLLREEGGIIKASLRTNENNINVAQIAAKFGGGGHQKAAGFSMKGELIKTSNGWKVKK